MNSELVRDALRHAAIFGFFGLMLVVVLIVNVAYKQPISSDDITEYCLVRQ